MNSILAVLALCLAFLAIWLNVLATKALRLDETLEIHQKVVQLVLVWVLPFFGSGFVLHMVYEHAPESLRNQWIPWPFRKLIFGEKSAFNQNRDEKEPYVYPCSRQSKQHDSCESVDSEGGMD